MNVPFVTASAELDAEFVAGAKERGIENIKEPSQRGRHAREHLQRDADRRRKGFG